MSKNKHVLLVPQYMNKFNCIGSDCEDSCCIGWRVDVDRATYKRYKNVKEKEIKALFDENITRKRPNGTEYNYATIKVDENSGRCTFLNKDNLCKIQLELGEKYLSNVCSNYPRVFNQVNGVIEKSATLSCPEIARLALLDPNGVEFDQIEEIENMSNIYGNELETENNSDNAKYYFWDIRIFTIQLLQNRKYTLADRLIFLGMFIQKLEEYNTEGKIGEIPQLISKYISTIESGVLSQTLSKIPVEFATQIKLLQAMIDLRIGYGVNSARYIECFNEFLQGLKYKKDTNIKEVVERYKEVYNTYYQPFMSDHHYIIENYLVNYVYKNLFPFGGETSIFEHYILLVIHFSLIKMHLIGMSGYHKGLSKEIVIKLIQSFTKMIEPNKNYLKQVNDILKNNGLTSMAYMSILIKN